MLIKKLILPASLAAAAIAAWAGTDNVAEEAAWVIGDQPIWKSEIEEAYQQILYERTPLTGDPYCVIPEQLAVEKLYLHQADIDTVEVQPAMVAQRVDGMLNYYAASLGSREKVEQVFNKSWNDLRESLTEMQTNQSRVAQVQANLTKDVTATPADVRRFVNSLPQDSLPYVPLQVEVQILTLQPLIPREEIEEVKARLRDYTERVNNGESDFSTLAILYSQDPGSSSRGGELGFMGRGQLVPEYAAVAFNLNDPKRVSKIVETEFGFHIIQLIEKRGDRINTRHILLRPKVSDKDLSDAITRLDSIRADMTGGKFTFEEAVQYLSQDKDTRNNRGQMVNQQNGTTRFEMSQLPQEVSKAVSTLQPGEISSPFIMKDSKNRDVVAIVKLSDRIEGHKANYADDYQQLKTLYEERKKEQILADWLNKKIADTYVRIEDGWRNCNFRYKGWIKEKASE
ncbi:MAG: peptidylprolyl isomerase [Bacteroides sp.]|nr:peptidylprolyl isomerase [Bacteroides sp.]MBD5377742.1 peptidylprolyl isomerase [Bacteroides sp.]